MESRYESYKEHVVRQFYREHFSGFDRQIVLVDCLHGLMAGEAAILDLQDRITSYNVCYTKLLRYMESFKGEAHLDAIQQEAQQIVSATLAKAGV